MKKIVTKLEKYFKLPNPGLRAFLFRNKVGNKDIYTTPLFKGKSMSQILAGFTVSDSIEGLLDFELSMRDKVGPTSNMKPFSEREEKVTEYYRLSNLEARPISSEAINSTVREWIAIKGIRALSRENTINEMKLSTNSGAPYFQRRSTITDKSTDGFSPVAVLGWRGQEGGPKDEDTKQRVVWMFPFDINVKELSIYHPIIKGLQKHNLVPALVSSDAVDERVTALFDTKGEDDLVIATDFSGYDQTFNPQAQRAVREIWEKLGVDKEWLDTVFPIKFNIPIVCTEEVTFEGAHGMASGSGGTNTDECAEHRALQYEAALSNHSRLNPNSMAYGDDGIISFPGITVQKVIESYTQHGHIMNADKQYVSKTSTTFLRRYYHRGYRPDGKMRGIYSAYRVLGRLHYQERYYDADKWNNKMLILRSLSILENAKWHPQFHELIEYVLTGDRDKLGLAIPGFFEVKTLSKEAQEARDVLGDDFLGFTKSNAKNTSYDAGINDWAVVKYLRSKKR